MGGGGDSGWGEGFLCSFRVKLKHSFLPTCISLWNNLPIDSVNCTTYVALTSHTAPLFI